jgi:hypothetical protein
MIGSTRARGSLVLVFATAAFALGAAQAYAGGQPHMSGHLQGFEASAVTGSIETVMMDIGAFTGNQAQGTLDGRAGTIPFVVTQPGSGARFDAATPEATGSNRPGIVLTASGTLRSLPDGTTLGTGDYRLRTSAGTDHGKLYFITSFDATSPPSLLGSSTGGFLQHHGTTGLLALDVTAQPSDSAGAPGSSFTGTVQLGAIGNPDLLVGSVGDVDANGFSPVDTLTVSSLGMTLLQGAVAEGGQPHMFGTLTTTPTTGGGKNRASFGLLLPAVQRVGVS